MRAVPLCVMEVPAIMLTHRKGRVLCVFNVIHSESYLRC